MKSLAPNAVIKQSELADKCKKWPQSAVKAKGSTPFGISCVVSSICSSILFDKRNIRPISHLQPEYGCCFSLPVVLGRQGIMNTIQMPLDSEEADNLARSVKSLKCTLDQICQDQ